MHSELPLTRDLVLIGGGHTHALVARMWGMKPVPGVRVTIINPGPTAPYSGMLPGMIAGHYQRPDLEIDLVKLARFAGARLVLGRAVGIDRTARLVHIDGQPPIFYDIASVDIGITTEMPALPGFAEHATPAKPLAAYAARWQSFVQKAKAGQVAPQVLVVGAGVAGVELALASAHRLRSEGLDGQVTLIEAQDQILRDIGAGARRALLARIQAAGVRLQTKARVDRVTAAGVDMQDGTHLPGAMVLGVAGARPQGWLAKTGLALSDGFIDVASDLRSVTDPRIFAAGDIAHLTHAPRPKAGVYAVRAAPILAHNLRADLTGGTRRAYQPQRDYLKLISTGGKHAVADKLGLRLEGDWLWRWKNHIDRKFMRMFHDLPRMAPLQHAPQGAALGVSEALDGQEMPCGGCAAKPGPAVLKDGLSRLPQPARPDVRMGAGDDAAILTCGAQAQVLTSDHFRAFTQDPYVLARIAAVHALGDVWAMGAQPQAALATLILPRMRDRMQEHTLREIMAGATEVFTAAGADLVGGHTSVGAELTLGFTVTGLHAGTPLGLSGARAGDALILTKPIGSGTILAGEMSGRADGAHVAGLLAQLQHPQGKAAALLGPVAHAMTDVTGYGLAGHLLTMLRASAVGAELSVADVPLFPGASALAAAGVRSTLFDKNAVLFDEMQGATPQAARHALLVDPQTASGLLAAVPGEAADDLVLGLTDRGYQAARIGQMVAGAPRITLR